ncbi:hypothetical protein ACFXAF_07910, partial [Kitasatospora sp. NPDC059463]
MSTALPARDGSAAVVTLDRREGPYGEVALRRRGATYEIIANGCFLMDTADGRSERLLVGAALEALERTGGAPRGGGWGARPPGGVRPSRGSPCRPPPRWCPPASAGPAGA